MVAGTGGGPAPPVVATSTSWTSPSRRLVDAKGNLIIADTNSDRIKVVADSTATFYGKSMTPSTSTTSPGAATPRYSGDGIAATSAELHAPFGVALEPAGNVVVADTYNNRIRVVATTTGTYYSVSMTSGDIYTVAGNGTLGYGGDGISAVNAELSSPNSVALDGQGDLEIADTGNNRVREVAAASSTTVPGAPMALVATASSAQVTLAWAAPTSTGGSPITGYNILRGTAPGQETPMPVASAVSGTTYTYTDSTVTSGITYYYEVEAANALGVSAPSNESAATPTPPLTVPGAPTALTATASSGQVTLDWAAPTARGAPPSPATTSCGAPRRRARPTGRWPRTWRAPPSPTPGSPMARRTSTRSRRSTRSVPHLLPTRPPPPRP